MTKDNKKIFESFEEKTKKIFKNSKADIFLLTEEEKNKLKDTPIISCSQHGIPILKRGFINTSSLLIEDEPYKLGSCTNFSIIDSKTQPTCSLNFDSQIVEFTSGSLNTISFPNEVKFKFTIEGEDNQKDIITAFHNLFNLNSVENGEFWFAYRYIDSIRMMDRKSKIKLIRRYCKIFTPNNRISITSRTNGKIFNNFCLKSLINIKFENVPIKDNGKPIFDNDELYLCYIKARLLIKKNESTNKTKTE